MGVSVCIVHYRSPRLLAQCLNSFDRRPPTVPCQIIVADNSAHIESVRDIVAIVPKAMLLEMPGNIGFSAANNQAARHANEQYLFFLNPDTEIHLGALEKLIARIENNPDIGAVGPMNIDSQGKPQYSCRAFPGYATFLGHRYSFLTRWFPHNPISAEYLQSAIDPATAREVDWVSGAALFMRRSDFERIGGFDESFFLYSEDVDLCYRLHQAGMKIFYEPSAVVQHHVGGSSGKLRFRALWERHRSMYTFYRKHYSLEIPLIDFATLLGIILRGVFYLGLELLGRKPHR